MLFRRINFFFHNRLKLFLIKLTVIFVALLLSAFVVLKFFKPNLLEKIYLKSSSYFFYKLSFGNYGFEQINIRGNKRVTSEEVVKVVNDYKLNFANYSESYQTFIQNLIDEIKTSLPWINKITITRTMPNLLTIEVTEYEPFAIWQNNGKKFIIDKDGNSMPYEDLEEFRNMVILSGKDANIHARSLFNIFVINPEISQMVYSATWVGDRRWDIRLDSGLLIKLPDEAISEAWQRLIKIYNRPGSIAGLKMIDLRIRDKVYLEYEASVMKEIKEL